MRYRDVLEVVSIALVASAYYILISNVSILPYFSFILTYYYLLLVY